MGTVSIDLVKYVDLTFFVYILKNVVSKAK